MDSRAPVILIVAVIVMGVAFWAILALRNAGGIDPERAKNLAEEAETECVLEGYGTDQCPKLVGRFHRDCLDEAATNSDGAGVDEKGYISCMENQFAATAGTDATSDGGMDATTPGRETSEGGSRKESGDTTRDGEVSP